MQETNLGILLADFQNGVSTASLKNYKTTLETGLRILELASYDLPVLNDIFKYNQGFNDLCSKVESYLTTNVHFNFYRFTRHDEQLKETFDLDISKYDIRSLLILIRCNYIANGAYSIPTRNLIESFEYIDQKKKTTSLKEIKEALPNVSEKYITSRYKDPQNINKSYLYAQMINANLYVLSYNHKLFTFSSSNGRVFNAFTSLNKIFRSNELAFQMTEIDVMSANAQFVDKIFKFDRWKGVYSNLMQAYEITRDQAKIKYNSTLNNHYLSVGQAKEVYANAGYDAKESLILAEATANNGKGSFYKLMANQEGLTMTSFIKSNFRNDRQIRLHDAVFYEPEFTTISNAIDLGISFGKSIIEKENLHLNLKIDTYKTVLSTENTEQFILKQYYNKSRCKQVLRTDNFTFYDDNFLQLSATFNISKPIISKEGIYRSPTEVEFIERLQKLYKISMYLNNGNDEHFKLCIEHLAKKHIQFNRNYIYAVLPTWNFDINDALEYVVSRNWVYHGSASLSLSQFNSLYHKERRQYVDLCNRIKLKEELKEIRHYIRINLLVFIDKDKYHSAKRYEVGKLINMVQDLIGVKKRDSIDNLNHALTIMDIPYRETNIGCPESFKYNSNLPISRHLQKKAYLFIKARPTILSKLYNAIENLDELENINQLFAEPKHQEDMNFKYSKVEPISSHEAFSEPIDYTHSVYSNHTARTAILQGKDFYIGYCTHVRISELMRNKLWENTNGFDSVKTLIQGQAIIMFNKNYENVYAESMMST
jgi:hypothetical protein